MSDLPSHSASSPRPLIVFALICAVVLSYFGLACPNPSGWISAQPTDIYNSQVKGWTAGHLHLAVEPRPELLQLANPYDPQQSAPYRIIDLSYYRSHYYIYFGPAPLLVVFLPWYLLTGTYLSEAAATAFLLSASFVLSAWFLSYLRQKLWPSTPAWTLWLAIAVLGWGNLQLVHLPNVAMYQVPRGSAYLALSALFITTYFALFGRRHRTLALLSASTAMGVAMASRPTFLVFAVALIPPLLQRCQQEKARASRLRLSRLVRWAAIAGGPAAAFGFGLLAYNAVRFGNPAEFGQHYQLNDAGFGAQFSWRFIGPHLRSFLFESPAWSAYFPFVRERFAPVGLLNFLPITWFALALFAVPLASDRAWSQAWWRSWVIGTLALFLLSAAYFTDWCGYEADFMGAVAFFACVGWLNLSHRSRGFTRVAATTLGALAAVTTIVVCVLTTGSFFRRWDSLKPLVQVLNTPVSLLEHLRGQDYGPLLLTLVFPDKPSSEPEPLVVTGDRDKDILYVRYHDASRISFGYFHAGGGVIETPPFSIDRTAVHRVRVFLGSLFPGPFHPASRPWRESDQVRARNSFVLEMDGKLVANFNVPFHPARPGEVTIGRNDAVPGITARAFSGRIIATTHLPLWDELVRTTIRPGRAFAMNLRFAGLTGVIDPILSSGSSSVGDLLFVQYLSNDRLQFKLMHAHGATETSEVIPFDAGKTYRLRLVWPALPASKPSAVSPPFTLLMDNQVVWQQAIPLTPVQADSVYFGINPFSMAATQPLFTAGMTSVESIDEASVLAAARLDGGQGRAVLAVKFPTIGTFPRAEPLIVTGKTGAADFVYANCRADGKVEIGYDHWGESGVKSEPLTLDREKTHHLEIELGSLHETGPGNSSKPTPFLVSVDGVTVLQGSHTVYPAGPGQIYLGRNPVGGSTCSEAFTGEIRFIERKP